MVFVRVFAMAASKYLPTADQHFPVSVAVLQSMFPSMQQQQQHQRQGAMNAFNMGRGMF